MSVGKSFNSFLLPLTVNRSTELSIALSALLCEVLLPIKKIKKVKSILHNVLQICDGRDLEAEKLTLAQI